MKILYVITSYGVGGASIQLHRMCKYLSKRNNEIVIVSMTKPESSEMVDELLNDVKNKFMNEYNILDKDKILLKSYSKPKSGINLSEYFKWVENK